MLLQIGWQSEEDSEPLIFMKISSIYTLTEELLLINAETYPDVIVDPLFIRLILDKYCEVSTPEFVVIGLLKSSQSLYPIKNDE